MTSKPARPSVELFSRNSSGLVRELSIVDAAWYGVLAAAALFGLLYVFPIPQAFLAGLSLPLSVLIAMAFMPAVFALYAGFASAMPRMGGDYLFQSRAIHPAVGFSFAFAWEVFIWVSFTTTGGLVVTTLALQPLLYNLGLAWNSNGLIAAGSWFGSPNGILISTLVLVILSFITTVYGMATYRKIQRVVIVPTIVLSNAILIVLLARTQESFISRFNLWHAKAIDVDEFSSQVQRVAAEGGFVDPGFSWKYTFLFLSVTGITWYLVFGAQGLLGEIKQASNFRKLFTAFSLGGLYLGIFSWIIPTYLFERMVGRDFMHAYAFAFNNGEIEAPAGATVVSFVMMMTSNPIVLILLTLGFLTIGYYFSTCVFLNMTRVLTAMGLDRTLPEWFAKVNERYHAPINAAIFFGAMSVGINVLFRYNSDVYLAMVFGGAFTSVGVIGLTGLAGVLFPWRARAVYDVSPVAQYRFLGLPLISVAGAVTFVGAGTVTIMNLVFPELGFTTGWSRALLVLSIAVAALWFYAYRAFLKSRYAINIDLAFAQVPPE
jgi:amino acid transporter